MCHAGTRMSQQTNRIFICVREVKSLITNFKYLKKTEFSDPIRYLHFLIYFYIINLSSIIFSKTNFHC